MQKVENDYGGHAKWLKDVARLTLIFKDCTRMLHAVRDEMPHHGLQVGILKNKIAYPTALGYSDLNTVVVMELMQGKQYLAEIQLNHEAMIEAKHKAHHNYQTVREELPKMVEGTSVDPRRLESLLVELLTQRSSLDYATRELMAKTSSPSDVMKLAHMIQFQEIDFQLEDLVALPVMPDMEKELVRGTTSAHPMSDARLTAAPSSIGLQHVDDSSVPSRKESQVALARPLNKSRRSHWSLRRKGRAIRHSRTILNASLVAAPHLTSRSRCLGGQRSKCQKSGGR